MKKRILSLLLTLCMLLPLLPVFPTLTASAQEGTLGEVGASTTLYDDITFSETAMPMTYGAWLASDLVGGGTEGYKTYLLKNKNVSWSGEWSMGAIVNGTYEKMEYIISFGNANNTATSANVDWHTTVSGFEPMIDKYMSGGTAGVWDAGKVMTHQTNRCIMRFTGNNAQSGIGAYGYTVQADGMIGLSLDTTTVIESTQDYADLNAYNANIANAYVMIRVNDKIVFPTTAKLDDRTTWGTYATMSAFAADIADLRLEVKAGDLVQFCISEKSGSDPKLALNPIVKTYASAEATEPTSSVTFCLNRNTDKHFTRGTVSQLLPAWTAANQNTTPEAAPDTAENRAAYREYLLTCGKLTQTGNWRVGGYTGENGAFEPIAYRIPFTTNSVFNTTDTAWNNTTWYTTASGYEYLTDLYIRDSAETNTFSGIWSHAGVVLYQKNLASLRSSLDNNSTFVYRYTVPAGAGGQITPSFAESTGIVATTRVCIVYDGTVIWPKGATLADSTTWFTGASTTADLNAALDGLHLAVEPGKTLDFCGTGASAKDTKLNITLTYTNSPTSSVYSEDASFTVGDLPLLYNAFLTEKGLTDGEEAKAAYRTHLLENGKLTWSGAWSRGAVDVATGTYEKIDCMIPIHGKLLSTTAYAEYQWTTNYSTYAKMVDTFLTGTAKPNLWVAGQVLQNIKDTVRFRLPGNENTGGIFAYAYEIPANGGGLIGFSAATDTTTFIGYTTANPPYEYIDLMYISIMINGTPVWPKGATRDSVANWANYADVDALNAALADVKIYTEPGDLVQLCVREKNNEKDSQVLSLDPVITFYSSADAVTDFEGSVTLSSGFAVDLFATAENKWVYEALDVTVNGETVAASEIVENSNLTLRAAYSLLGIAATEMSDTFTYSFTNRSDGHVYRSGSASLATLLAQYLDKDEKTADLVKATLNYGAAAQIYFGYNTGNLANSVLSSETDRTTSSMIAGGEFEADATVEKLANATLHWNSATLLLGDIVRIKLFVNADEVTDPSTLTVKNIDENGVAVETEWQVIPRGEDTTGKYFKVIINVPMIDFYSYLKLAVYQDGKQASDTLTYSVGAYACRVYNQAEDETERINLNRMVDTILALGAAANEYYEEEHIDPMAYADVREIDTGLAVAPSLIQTVNTRKELQNILTLSPSHALLRINANLYVVNEKGEALASLAEAYDLLGGRVIPLLAPTSAEAYDALATYFTATKYADMMLLSGDAEKIAALKAVMPMLRTVLDLRKADPKTLDFDALVVSAAACNTYTFLLPAEAATAETSTRLISHYMMPWYVAGDASVTETARLVTAGAAGIVTDDRAAVEECLTDRTLWAEGSLNRVIPITGHQGSTFNPTTQANTLPAFDWAFANGATTVEFDVYLSKDNVPVIMHDSTVDGTTNGTGAIEEMTLAQIKELWVDSHSGAEPVRVPTLEEIFETYKDTDAVLNIEIKSSKTTLIPYIAELINEYEIWDQCLVCCFSDSLLALMREACPQVPALAISGSADSFETLVTRTATYGAVCSVRYDTFNYSNLQKLAYRGVTTLLWTPDADEQIYTTYARGVWTLCLNYVNKISDVVATLATYQDAYTLTAGGSIEVALNATTYKGAAADASAAEMVILSGNTSLSYENGVLSATEAGTATVMFRMPVKLGGTNITVYVYTAPVTVTVA